MKRGRGKYSYITCRVDAGRSPRPCTSKSFRPVDTVVDGNSRIHSKHAETTQVSKVQEGTETLNTDKAVTKENSNEKSKSDFEDLQTRHKKELRNSLTSFGDELDSIRTTYERRIQWIKTDHEEEVKYLKTSLEQNEAILAAKFEEIEQLRADLEHSRQGREGLLKTLTEVSQVHDSDIEELSLSITKIVKRNQELQSENSALNNRVLQIQVIADNNNFEAKKQEQDAKISKIKIKSLEEEKSDLLSRIEDLTSRMNSAVSGGDDLHTESSPKKSAYCDIACQTEVGLEVDPGAAINTKAELVVVSHEASTEASKEVILEHSPRTGCQRGSPEKLQFELDKHVSLVESLRTSLDEQQSRLRLIRQTNRGEIRQLKEALAEKDEELRKVKLDLEKHSLLSETLTEKNKAIAGMEQGLAQLNDEMDKMKRQLDQQHIANVRLKEAALLFEEMVGELEKELEDKSAKLESLQLDSQSKDEKLEASRNDLSKLRTETSKVIAENESLRSNISVLTTQQREAKMKLKNCEHEIHKLTELCREMDVLKRELEMSNSTIKKLRGEYSADHYALSIAESKADRFQRELKLAQDELEELRQAVKNAEAAHRTSEKKATLRYLGLQDELCRLTEISAKLSDQLVLAKQKKKSLKQRIFGSEKSDKDEDQRSGMVGLFGLLQASREYGEKENMNPAVDKVNVQQRMKTHTSASSTSTTATGSFNYH